MGPTGSKPASGCSTIALSRDVLEAQLVAARLEAAEIPVKLILNTTTHTGFTQSHEPNQVVVPTEYVEFALEIIESPTDVTSSCGLEVGHMTTHHAPRTCLAALAGLVMLVGACAGSEAATPAVPTPTPVPVVVVEPTTTPPVSEQSSPEPEADSTDQGDIGPVLEELYQRGQTVSRAGGLYRNVAEAMPNVTYAVDDGTEFAFADLYVTGRVVDVSPGIGLNWTDEDDEDAGDTEQTIELEFNSDDALISTIHVTVDVTRSIADPRAPLEPDQIVFGLALDSPVDLDAAREELVSLGQVALLMYQPSPVYAYDPSVWTILEDGAFLGLVGTDGSVTFPVLSGDVDGPGGGNRLTIDELEAGDGGVPIAVERLASGELVRAG